MRVGKANFWNILLIGLICVVFVSVATLAEEASDETWTLQGSPYIVSGQSSPNGGREFWEMIRQSFGRSGGLLGGYELLPAVEKHLRDIKGSDSIFLISPLSVADLKGLQELGDKYPELLPLPYRELRYYPLPLVCFACDPQTGKMRGIIIADSVDSSLAESLVKKGVPLKTPLKYRKGQLRISKRLETPWEGGPRLGISPEWEKLEGKYFIVAYRPGYKEDAEKILGYANYARQIVTGKYPHKLPQKVVIYLYDRKSYFRPPFTMWTNTKKYEVNMLTPSDQTDRWMDDRWYKSNIIHEYAHIPFYQDLFAQRYHTVPSWFSEGFAEYFSLFCSSPDILQKYREQLDKIRDMVRRGEGYFIFIAGDKYYGGAYLVKYMIEKYGQKAVTNLIKSSSLSFAKALQDELNVNPREFENNWLKWAANEFGIDYDKLYGY